MSQSLRSRPTTKPKPTREDPTSSSSDDDHPRPPQSQPTSPRSLSQRALSQALSSTANLSNLLPTGTILAFQLLTPIFTNNGFCDSTTRTMTLGLLALLAISCFLSSFTDTVKCADGKQVYYGFATFNGIFLFDCPDPVEAGLKDLSKFKISFIDGVHSVLSLLVFVAFALKDKNVLSCFYPSPELRTQEILDVVPVGVGVICSLLFIVFPTRRRGIGYPVTPGK